MAKSTSTNERKPNILVIFGDDIGVTNVSAYSGGLMGYETPNIDRIGKEGVRFLHYYAEQSCTAGRAAFLTGQHGIRSGLTKVGYPGAPMGMSQLDPSIGGLLKNLGYATGQFGKNHVGDLNQTLPTVNLQSIPRSVRTGGHHEQHLLGLAAQSHRQRLRIDGRGRQVHRNVRGISPAFVPAKLRPIDASRTSTTRATKKNAPTRRTSPSNENERGDRISVAPFPGAWCELALPPPVMMRYLDPFGDEEDVVLPGLEV